MTFDQSMNRLAILPAQGVDHADMLIRKEIYFEALSDLDTPLFVAGVASALRECRWFPTPAELRERADAARPTLLALPPPIRTREQVEADREECRRGLELIRAAVANTPARTLRVSTPEPSPRNVYATDERLAQLRAQGREIQAPEVTTLVCK